ncbi:MAG: Phosphate regulon transcriptional regulatory protein PhoB (SphR) [uncultured Thermomicrobiales bacterium]|uniref:Phosphate regulon transcriptional regulatory protein PhoB n=1 Tax=uncultured Thermomicrobiales bacterium TaxID=1645740 RepID=A0A6J4UXD0_9BACT|nr:MAG: Phosphate regulon transcriptional regulatory protein PhoB (SphR) [uncultured Thermomicrobiales bacterium]
MVKKVLVVDDERVLAETIGYNLRREGYAAVAAYDGQEALQSARREKPDAVILDVMLPKLDGFEVCRALRRETTVPILMLTAREGEIDKVLGLELGADDYLTKPFSMRELLARVKALLRRSEMLADATDESGTVETARPLEVGPLRIDAAQHRATWDNRPLELKPKEFDLLLFLARNRGTVLSRDVLLERVWGYDYPIDTRTVDVHVRWLREKIEANPGRPAHLQTVRGLGYRFVV